MKKLFLSITVLLLSSMFCLADGDTPLEKQMDHINDSFKAMRKVENNAEGAKLAQQMAEAAVKAYSLTPKMVEKGNHPGPKDKAMAGYRIGIAKLLVAISQLEAAYLDGDAEKIAEAQQQIKDIRKHGHTEYKEPDED